MSELDFSRELYSHSNAATFLKAVYLQRKSHNPRFSFRSWARELGLREATPLSLVIQGKRGLPLHYVPALSKCLKLNKPAQRYLEAITRRAASRTQADQLRWSKTADRLASQARSTATVVTDFHPFSNPLAMLLLNLVELEDFRMDPEWISERIRRKASREQIEQVYQSLVQAGHLKRLPTGALERQAMHLTSTQDVPSASIRKFHEESLLSAISSLHLLDVAEREFGSYFFTARRDVLPEMKQKIRDFLRAFIAEYSESSEGHDSIYQINLNLTPKTQKVTEAS